jgi:eukaryotic-like serine/threonine-protein kinase
MASGGATSTSLLRFGDEFELDLRAYELRRAGQLLKLERIPTELLRLLIEQRGQLVTRDQIVERVWGKDVFLDTDNSINAAIRKIRHVLGDDPEHPKFVQTLTGRGYRFIAPIEEVVPPAPQAPTRVEAPSSGGPNGNGIEVTAPETSHLARGTITSEPDRPPVQAKEIPRGQLVRWKIAAATVAVATAILFFAGLYVRGVHANKLQPDDTIVLGDFANSTGDPIFDDTLKQGLTLTLRQSPFLNILPQSKISKTLRLMTRDSDTALTPAVANEVCQRAGSKAYIAGAIGSLGSEYVLGLKAVNCHSGDTLAQEQVTAAKKEQVLTALGEAATKLRNELGESLTTVEKFDVPLTEATTNSLEALRQYSLGLRTWNTKGERDAIPYLKRATELDPNFASAYVSLGTVYGNLELPAEAAENMTRAYELKDRVSERERFYIQGHYYRDVTEELEKAIPVYKQWIEEYASEPTPHTNLGNIYHYLGRFENALAEHQQALRLEPNGVLIYENLALNYASLNRFDDSIAMVNQAFSRKLDDVTLHLILMQVAFLRGDPATVQQQFDWGMGKPGIEDTFLGTQSDLEAATGHLAKARELTRRAIQSALQSGSKEMAAFWQGVGALHEAEMGNTREAAKQAEVALTISRNRDTLILAALALARAGDSDRARVLADQLNRALPQGTFMQFYWLPSLRAMMDLNHLDSAAAQRTLQPAAPYDLCSAPPWQGLIPIYLRGQAFLQSHQGAAAAIEFQKVLAHRADINFLWGTLANLELGRAYAISGDTTKAKKAYQDFFTLWKDADADIPVLKAAKVEYAKLAAVSESIAH